METKKAIKEVVKFLELSTDELKEIVTKFLEAVVVIREYDVNAVESIPLPYLPDMKAEYWQSENGVLIRFSVTKESGLRYTVEF